MFVRNNKRKGKGRGGGRGGEMDRERIGKGEKEEKGKKRSATPCGLAWPKAFKRARNYARRRRVRASLFSRASPSSLPSPHRTGHSSADESERRTRRRVLRFDCTYLPFYTHRVAWNLFSCPVYNFDEGW